MDSEPVGIVGAIQAFVVAIVALLTGLGMQPGIAAAIGGVISAGILLATWFVRSQVWSRKSVEALVGPVVPPVPPAG